METFKKPVFKQICAVYIIIFGAFRISKSVLEIKLRTSGSFLPQALLLQKIVFLVDILILIFFLFLFLFQKTTLPSTGIFLLIVSYFPVVCYFEKSAISYICSLFFLTLCIAQKGFFKKQRALKTIGSILTISAGVFLQISQLNAISYKEFFNFLVCLLAFPAIYFVINVKYDKPQSVEKTLNPSKYPELSKRDIEFLQAIFDGEKFQHIANLHNLELSTVQNRMCKIYKILGLPDKTILLTKYTGIKKENN